MFKSTQISTKFAFLLFGKLGVEFPFFEPFITKNPFFRASIWGIAFLHLLPNLNFMPEDYFDFHSVSEESDNLDFSKMIPCPHCQKPIAHNATHCLYCGKTPAQTKSKVTWLVWVGAVLVLAIFIAAILR